MSSRAGGAEAWWDAVAGYTKAAQAAGCDPDVWAAQVSSALAAWGIALPSPELAQLLATHLDHCSHGSGGNAALAWKYIERALAADLAPAMLVLALLSDRSIPYRRSKPVAYRLYLELVQRYAFYFASQIKGPDFTRMMGLIDDVLQLTENFCLQISEPWALVVQYLFSIMWKLINAVLDDEGLKELKPENVKWDIKPQDMEKDGEHTCNEEKMQYHEKLKEENTAMAIETISQFLHHKVTANLLSLARQNMPSQWIDFTRHLEIIATCPSALRNSTGCKKLQQLIGDNWEDFSRKCKPNHPQAFCGLIASQFQASYYGHFHKRSSYSLWIPIDLYLEDCIYGSIAATSSIEILSGLVKALRAVIGNTWHDAFLALWLASLRLVQRERDPPKGHQPSYEIRLCMLLSITPLCIANIIEEQEALFRHEAKLGNQNHNSVHEECRKDLSSSLQIIGDCESLLAPPQSAVLAANQAAVKAMMFVSGLPVGSQYVKNSNIDSKTSSCTGNLWHLIVEACIVRNLLDTSAYFWHGYANGCISQPPCSLPNQLNVWSTFMKGASLTSSIVDHLVTTSASNLAELEKIFQIALNGSNNDRFVSATVLCGESLIRGWHIQEHAVRFLVRLLSPPFPFNIGEIEDYWISHGPVLQVVLARVSSTNCVKIFMYHGLVPELAGGLMAICEIFGSCSRNISCTNTYGEKITAHSVFSVAFILLSRLWNFDYPLQYCRKGDIAAFDSNLTPEYLLLLRNSRLVNFSNNNEKKNHIQLSTPGNSQPIFVDSFPNLKSWYRQHQACLASTLSGLIYENKVHESANALLRMMFKKDRKECSQSLSSESTESLSLTSSSGFGCEDGNAMLELSAWKIMEAVPFVVDAALNACSHGELSPRELSTGLKDLTDYLPASLATIINYFSSEITRGVWQPAFMNGTDWPSPATNLSFVEENIKKIVAASGVDVPSLDAGGDSQAALPLPLAAFASLSITFRVDKTSKSLLILMGTALRSLAASCPWPSMPMVASFWVQKNRQRSNFILLSASGTIFHRNNDAVVQLLRSCFGATIGIPANSFFSKGGVSDLLGHTFNEYASGSIAPGILFLRVYRYIKDIVLLAEDILSQLMTSVKEIVENIFPEERSNMFRRTLSGMKYGHVSLDNAMTRVKTAFVLAATFVWLSGGQSICKLLYQDMIPSLFLSEHVLGEGSGELVHVLSGHALAYFAVLSGMFFWQTGSKADSKRRSTVIAYHVEFLANALEGKISLGCHPCLWRSYVSGFLSLVVECVPNWVLDMELSVLKRLSRGLRKWNEFELALALLRKRGIEAINAAAEMILMAE